MARAPSVDQRLPAALHAETAKLFDQLARQINPSNPAVLQQRDPQVFLAFEERPAHLDNAAALVRGARHPAQWPHSASTGM